jgi:putative membrane protein
MGKLIIRLVLNAVTLWVAASLVPGITLSTNVVGVLLVALIFGVVNAFIRPVVTLLTCPLNAITLGLFTLVINALMLMLTSYVAGEDFIVRGFLDALLGGIIVSIVSLLLNMLVRD